jgi:hypothetical protein
MILDIAKYLGLYCLLIALQRFVISNVVITNSFGLFFQPQLLVMFILLLPPRMSHTWLILVSFAAGLILDMFFNTMGMNAAVCTLIGFMRYYATRDIEKEIATREEDNKIWTSKKGRPWKWTYFISFILLYHFVFIMIDSLGRNFFPVTIPAVAISSAATFIFTITLEDLIYKPSKS